MELTLSQAAELIGIPQKRLYRAVKAGKLNATERHQGSRWEYLVTREDLEEFGLSTEQPVDQDSRSVAQDSRPTATDPLTDRPTSRPVGQPTDRLQGQPPVELYLALVDRLQRAERRTVELELTLRQSQRLLSENAESITEKEALRCEVQAQLAASEAVNQLEIAKLNLELEALAQTKAAEEARLSAELEETRHRLEEAQKPKGLFSWLSLRKKRTTSSQVDKAV